MQDDDAPADPELSRALDAWPPLAPPAGFADRVLAARDAGAAPPRPRRWRIGVVACAVAAGAAAAGAAVVLRSPHRAAAGTLRAERRATAVLGDRGVAVVEPASDLSWRIDDRGAAEVVQRRGDVFYRVEPGGPFVVHTPAGDVRVTGTCFRVEVEDMNTNHKLVLSGLAGAAVASAVLLTVYEGHVIAETRSAKTELAAGTRATLRGDSTTVASATLGTAADDSASREQLLARTREQQAQLIALRARLARLEPTAAPAATEDAADSGRPWYDPSPEQLAAWVASCTVRADVPDFEHGAPTPPSGATADEVDGFNAAMADTARRWHDLVRSLYLETTGDTAGADTLSFDSMHREIQEKSPPGEYNALLQRLSRERAGLDRAPADLSKASPLERLIRAHLALGDQTEAALARRLGPDRARAIRGDGWSWRSELGGCPSAGGGK